MWMRMRHEVSGDVYSSPSNNPTIRCIPLRQTTRAETSHRRASHCESHLRQGNAFSRMTVATPVISPPAHDVDSLRAKQLYNVHLVAYMTAPHFEFETLRQSFIAMFESNKLRLREMTPDSHNPTPSFTPVAENPTRAPTQNSSRPNPISVLQS